MSEKKFDKYYIDSKNANRIKNILQFVNNCEFNDIKQARSAQTRTSQIFSGLLKKYFNGQFRFSDLLVLKAFVDQFNVEAYNFLFDKNSLKPADPYREMFELALEQIDGKDASDKDFHFIHFKNLSTDKDCFYTRYQGLCEYLKETYKIVNADEIPSIEDAIIILYAIIRNDDRFITVGYSTSSTNVPEYYGYLQELHNKYLSNTGNSNTNTNTRPVSDALKKLLEAINSGIFFDEDENPIMLFFENFLGFTGNNNIYNRDAVTYIADKYMKIKKDEKNNPIYPANNEAVVIIIIEALLEYSLSFILRYFIFSAAKGQGTVFNQDKYFPNDNENLEVLNRNNISYIDTEYNIRLVNNRATSGATSIGFDDLCNLFGLESSDYYAKDDFIPIKYTVIYKENNNYFRDIQKSAIYESLLGIYLLNLAISDTSTKFSLRDVLFDLNLYQTLISMDIFQTKYSLIFNMYYTGDSKYKTLYRYFKSNPIWVNLAEDLDIVNFIYGDYAVSSGFGYGTLVENSVQAVDLFLSAYEESKKYFLTVLHNYSYSSEDGYRAYAFLTILSQAITIWNDHFQKNLSNVDFYNSDVIDSFLRSFGLENISKEYVGISDDMIKLKIVQNYTKLMREKGTTEVIKDLSDILKSDTIVSELKPMYITRFNNSIIRETKDDNKFTQGSDDRVVFFPTDLENDDIFNNIEKYLNDMQTFEDIVNDDPYWDSKDVNEELILNNFALNVMPSKYLKRENLDVNNYRHLLAAVLLSGARFDGEVTHDALKEVPAYDKYTKWCKRIVYIYEFLAVLYTSRVIYLQNDNPNTKAFPIDESEKQRLVPYAEAYNYIGNNINQYFYGLKFSGFINALKTIIYYVQFGILNDQIANSINVTQYNTILSSFNTLSSGLKLNKNTNTDNDEDVGTVIEDAGNDDNIDTVEGILATIRTYDICNDGGDANNNPTPLSDIFKNKYPYFIGNIYKIITSIEELLSLGKVSLAYLPKITGLLDILKSTVFQAYTYNEVPIYSIQLINDIPRLLYYRNIDVVAEVRQDIQTLMMDDAVLSEYVIPELTENNAAAIQQYVEDLVKLSDSSFSKLIDILENVYVRYISQIYDEESIFSPVYNILNNIDSPKYKAGDGDYVGLDSGIYTDILENFLSYTVQLLQTNINSDVFMEDDMDIVESYSYKVEVYVTAETLPIIDEKFQFFKMGV